MEKLIILSLITFGSIFNSFAQATASATASATIVNPITISKIEDMNFGNIESNSSSNAIVLTPSGSRSSTNGIILPHVTGLVSAASFKILGSGSYTFAITLPSSALILTSGENSMVVDEFTSNPSGKGTLSAGTQTINVGATLHIIELQPSGFYQSVSPFEVTINYN